MKKSEQEVRTPLPSEAHDLGNQFESLALLGDPIRRSIYFYVCGQPTPVGRDQAATAVGISRALATFHLEKLLAEDLLVATYRRLSGRTGPGAGRTAKLYRRSGKRIAVALPPRNYELLARLQAAASKRSQAMKQDLEQAAQEFGRELGRGVRGYGRAPTGGPSRMRRVLASLAELGFEPMVDPSGELRLRNCPFADLATQQTDLVCGMNVALMRGLASGAQLSRYEAVHEPRDDACCVVFRRQSGDGRRRGAGRQK